MGYLRTSYSGRRESRSSGVAPTRLSAVFCSKARCETRAESIGNRYF